MHLLRFFITTLLFYTPILQADVSAKEKAALLSLVELTYYDFLYDEWVNPKETVCRWKGVSCDSKQQHIVKLAWPFFNMKELKPQIAQLTALKELTGC